MGDEQTIEELNENLKNEKDASKAKEWSEAYKNKVEADTLEYREANKLDVELKKEKYKIIAATVTATGMIAVAVIKLIEVLEFQERDFVFETNGNYANHKRHRF